MKILNVKALILLMKKIYIFQNLARFGLIENILNPNSETLPNIYEI